MSGMVPWRVIERDFEIPALWEGSPLGGQRGLYDTDQFIGDKKADGKKPLCSWPELEGVAWLAISNDRRFIFTLTYRRDVSHKTVISAHNSCASSQTNAISRASSSETLLTPVHVKNKACDAYLSVMWNYIVGRHVNTTGSIWMMVIGKTFGITLWGGSIRRIGLCFLSRDALSDLYWEFLNFILRNVTKFTLLICIWCFIGLIQCNFK